MSRTRESRQVRICPASPRVQVLCAKSELLHDAMYLHICTRRKYIHCNVYPSTYMRSCRFRLSLARLTAVPSHSRKRSSSHTQSCPFNLRLVRNRQRQQGFVGNHQWRALPNCRELFAIAFRMPAGGPKQTGGPGASSHQGCCFVYLGM